MQLPAFIKENLGVTILVAFAVLALVQLIIPTFYDLITSCIELVVLWFALKHVGLLK